MNAPVGSPWTPERIDKLRQLWAADFTATEIAETMGAGISRNSVIGKLHRLGGAPRTKQPRRSSSQKRTQRRKPSLAPTVAHDPVPAAPEPPVAVEMDWHATEAEALVQRDTVTIADLRFPISQCRWIDGEASANALYCGARTKPGKSYCDEHHARAWRPRQRRAA